MIWVRRRGAKAKRCRACMDRRNVRSGRRRETARMRGGVGAWGWDGGMQNAGMRERGGQCTDAWVGVFRQRVLRSPHPCTNTLTPPSDSVTPRHQLRPATNHTDQYVPHTSLNPSHTRWPLALIPPIPQPLGSWSEKSKPDITENFKYSTYHADILTNGYPPRD